MQKNIPGGVYEAISTVKEYEEDNFGQVTTDFSEPERVVNMYVYILGEEVLYKSKTLDRKWDKKLSEQDLEEIADEI
jgi:hypothetical protein